MILKGNFMSGTLHLHPTHPFWKQLVNPCCPVCRQALTPKDPVRLKFYENHTYTVFHEKCGEKELA
jgi:hypothetical protein